MGKSTSTSWSGSLPQTCTVPEDNAGLPIGFFARDPRDVAPALLGKWLFREDGDQITGGLIVETEAYLAADDPACHAAVGPNRKNKSMFGRAGRAYVYVIHGSSCLNVVTDEGGLGSAVLIRALEPRCGIDVMTARRGGRSGKRELTTGPGRLCEAMNVTREWDGHDLTSTQKLWIQESDLTAGDLPLRISERIGVTSGRDLMLRYLIKGNPYVSGPKRWRL